MDNGPVTFEGRNYKLKRGEIRTITNEADILYFQSQTGISVEMEEGVAPKVVKSSAKASLAPVAKGGKKAPKSVPPPPVEPEADDPVDGKYTAEQLGEFKIDALSELLDGLGYEVPEASSKESLIALIIAAQDDES